MALSPRAFKTLLLLLTLFCLPAPAAAQSFTLSLPGTLVDAAGVTGPNGRPGVALLLAANRDGKGAKSLLFLDPERRSLQRLIDNLHEEVNAVVAFDLAGNGVAGPLAGMPGVIFAPVGGGGARKVLDEARVDLRSVSGETAGRPWLPAAHTGLLELFERNTGGSGLQHRIVLQLPVRAERQRWGLLLTSPPVTLLPGDPPLFAVGPEVGGRRRLQTLLIPAAGGETVESWSLLPADERVMSDRRYLRLDGVPMLAATSFQKIGVFAKKRFRLYLLGRDRSRKGTAPVLAFETDCPLWFPLDASAADADGDGHQDLVLVHPGGLRGKELQVTIYRGLGNGQLDPKPRSWKLGAEARDWLYGSDLTGDGVPDLLVYAGDRFLLYAGDAKASRPLGGRPILSIAVPGAPQREVEVEVGESGNEAPGPNRLRLLQAFTLPGGSRLAFAQGFQKDGKTVLTVAWRR